MITRLETANSKRRRTGSSMAEFGPALIVFFLVILFPMINLIAMGTGAGTIYLLAKESAGKAGNSTTYADALSAAESAAVQIASSGFGQFAKLKPVAGYNGSGIDLYVSDTNISSMSTNTYGPNNPPPIAVDTSTDVYTYDVRATFDMGPFVNMGEVPFVKDVPGVGKPARLSFLASSAAEHPEGIGTGVGPVAGGGTSTTGPPGGGLGRPVTSPPGGDPTVGPVGSPVSEVTNPLPVVPPGGGITSPPGGGSTMPPGGGGMTGTGN